MRRHISTHPLPMYAQLGRWRSSHNHNNPLKAVVSGFGQTVPEQVVHDKYRALVIELLQGRINDQWLVHLPMHQLREMLELFQEQRYSTSN